MNTQQTRILDNAIRKILPSEQVPDLTNYYKQIPKVSIHGVDTYLFDKLIPDGIDFKVSKHDRFLPVPSHLHTFIELNYVYSGFCNQIIDGKKITLKQGDLIIIDTKVPHAILKTGENDILINILIRKKYFTTAFFENLSNNGVIFDFLLNAISYTTSHNQYIVFHTQKNEHVVDSITQILWETYFPSICSYQFTENYLNLLFIDLLRVFEFDTHNNSKNKAHGFQQKLNVLHYIEENFDSCTLKSISEHFNYTPTYLSTFIKKSTGKTYSQLVREYRLSKVCFYLANTTNSIDEIASECGFSNLTFFYQKFSNHYGVTPKQYRIEHHFK